jgi:putative flavoprotein involved in K+ transport
VVKLADLKLARLLAAIDSWIETADPAARPQIPERPEPTRLSASPRLELDLGGGEISTVIWATGYRPDYAWLRVPVLDHKGGIRHEGGVADAPGLYVMGLPFMRRRKSSFLFGVEDDAREICDHLVANLRVDRAAGLRASA